MGVLPTEVTVTAHWRNSTVRKSKHRTCNISQHLAQGQSRLQPMQHCSVAAEISGNVGFPSKVKVIAHWLLQYC
jgi:hypothetical protein